MGIVAARPWPPRGPRRARTTPAPSGASSKASPRRTRRARSPAPGGEKRRRGCERRVSVARSVLRRETARRRRARTDVGCPLRRCPTGGSAKPPDDPSATAARPHARARPEREPKPPPPLLRPSVRRDASLRHRPAPRRPRAAGRAQLNRSVAPRFSAAAAAGAAGLDGGGRGEEPSAARPRRSRPVAPADRSTHQPIRAPAASPRPATRKPGPPRGSPHRPPAAPACCLRQRKDSVDLAELSGTYILCTISGCGEIDLLIDLEVNLGLPRRNSSSLRRARRRLMERASNSAARGDSFRGPSGFESVSEMPSRTGQPRARPRPPRRGRDPLRRRSHRRPVAVERRRREHARPRHALRRQHGARPPRPSRKCTRRYRTDPPPARCRPRIDRVVPQVRRVNPLATAARAPVGRTTRAAATRATRVVAKTKSSYDAKTTARAPRFLAAASCPDDNGNLGCCSAFGNIVHMPHAVSARCSMNSTANTWA